MSRCIYVTVIDLEEAEVVLHDGERISITALLDEEQRKTFDLAQAVACVAEDAQDMFFIDLTRYRTHGRPN